MICVETHIPVPKGLSVVGSISAAKIFKGCLVEKSTILHPVHGVDFNDVSASVVIDHLVFEIVLNRSSLVKFTVAAVFSGRRWAHSLVGINHGIFYGYTLVSAGIISLREFRYVELSAWLCDLVETSENSCCLELVLPLQLTYV